MSKFEEPILPPEDSDPGNRYESSNLDIDQLREYLSTTLFENKNEIEAALTGEYRIGERKDIDSVRAGMTRIFDTKQLAIARLIEDNEYWGTPLSGVEPQPVLRTRIKTLDGKVFDLSVFKIFNRNNYFRHEYVLTPVEELEQAG